MNMGNYAHGNQPIQNMLYLYNWSGQPWKAQQRIREVMDKFYTCHPDGYCGDEDNGQTSAWYVFSALGFYPVCPATDQYILGTPLFKKAEVSMSGGKTLLINAPDNGRENFYVSDMKVNGKKYTRTYLEHDLLRKGAVINFTMSDEPSKNRSVSHQDRPYSFSNQR